MSHSHVIYSHNYTVVVSIVSSSMHIVRLPNSSSLTSLRQRRSGGCHY